MSGILRPLVDGSLTGLRDAQIAGKTSLSLSLPPPLSWSWDIHFLLSLDIRVPGSWVFELLGLHQHPYPSRFSGLRLRLVVTPSGSPSSQAVRLGLNYTTGFPRSPAGRWQTVGFSLRDHESIPITNLLICICRYGYRSY